MPQVFSIILPGAAQEGSADTLGRSASDTEPGVTPSPAAGPHSCSTKSRCPCSTGQAAAVTDRSEDQSHMILTMFFHTCKCGWMLLANPFPARRLHRGDWRDQMGSKGNVTELRQNTLRKTAALPLTVFSRRYYKQPPTHSGASSSCDPRVRLIRNTDPPPLNLAVDRLYHSQPWTGSLSAQ